MILALTYISVLSVLFPIVLTLRNFQKGSQTLSFLSVFLYISFAFDIASGILAMYTINNMFLFHFYTLLKFIFFTLFFRMYFQAKWFNWFSIVLIVAFLIFHLAVIFNKGNIDTFDSAEQTVASLVIIIYCIAFYMHSLININEKDITDIPEFWVTSGALIYLAGNLFLFMTYNTTVTKGSDYLYLIHSGLYMVLMTFYSIALWKNKASQE